MQILNGATIKDILKDGSSSAKIPSLWEKKSLFEAKTKDKKLKGKDQSCDSAEKRMIILNCQKNWSF